MNRLLRHIIAGAIALSVTVVVSACASPVEGLWPPPLESVQRTVSVSIDTWHAMITFQNDTPHASRFMPHVYEEWGYAERAWYLEGKMGVSGVVRALFWPTQGVVEIGHYDRVWAERTPQPPSDHFSFRLSEAGYQRLQQHLHATLLSEEPVVSVRQSTFYPATRSYHLFHTCHQYAALALREAGLPLSPFWAFNRMSLTWQLRRAARLSKEQPTKLPPGNLR